MLAFFAALFGVGTLLLAPHAPKPAPVYAFGVFCLLIAAACVARGRIAAFCSSVVGSAVFLAGAWYVVSELFDGPLWSGRRSEPSLVNACLFLVCFGVPGAMYALSARFGFDKRGPRWDVHAG
jgi:hypothetical protein